jgi:hypothetical protein
MTVAPPSSENMEDFASSQDESTAESDEGKNEIEIIPSSKIAWLQEVSLTATKILVAFVAVIVITLSLIAKVDWWIIILRAGVSILLLGFLGYLLNWFLAKYLIEAKLAELKEKKEAEDAERLLREQAELEALAQLQQEEDEEGGIDIER